MLAGKKSMIAALVSFWGHLFEQQGSWTWGLSVRVAGEIRFDWNFGRLVADGSCNITSSTISAYASIVCNKAFGIIFAYIEKGM